MPRIRLGFVLTIIAAYAGIAQSAPLHDARAEVISRLAPAFATHDPMRLATAFRAMGNYGLPAADIVESTVNSSGYQYLERDDLESAISVFELNVEIFADSANAWDSLGEALMTKGDHSLAIRYYQRSLELDPQNHNARAMIERMLDAPQVSQAGDL